MPRFALAVFALYGVLLSIPLFGQNTALPTAILDCEDGLGCITWTFHGVNGEGHWSQGSVADLRIQRFGKDILIYRTDRTGTSQGMMATYSGAVKGNKIDGYLTWHWSGHGRASDGGKKWHATIQSFASNNPTPPPNNSDQPLKAPVTAVVEEPKPKSTPVVLSAECSVAGDTKAKYLEGKRLYYRHEFGAAWPCFQQAGAGNNAAAMAFIGEFYDYNYVGNGDSKLAIEWYTKAASLGDTEGMEGLGLIYRFGRGVTADTGQSIAWYTKAANAGDANAMRILGDIYYSGKSGVPMDMATARKWYEKAAAKGDEEAKYTLAHFGLPLWNLNGIWAGQVTSSIPDVIRIEQKGDTITAVRLRLDYTPMGLEFFNGAVGDQNWGMKDTPVQVAKYSMASLLLGSQNEQTGNMRPAGYFTAKLKMLDPDRFTLDGQGPFERMSSPEPDDLFCVHSNYFAAMGAYAYQRGEQRAKEKNYPQAVCWYVIASREKQPRAATSLGVLEMQGLAGPDTGKTSLEWLQQGGEGGDYYAAVLLADLYAKGNKEVAVDKAKAQHWSEEAARLHAIQEQQEAAERKADAQYQATMHMFESTLYLTAQVINNAVSRSPGCDISCGPADMLTCQERINLRDKKIANGELNCDPKPLDFGPVTHAK